VVARGRSALLALRRDLHGFLLDWGAQTTDVSRVVLGGTQVALVKDPRLLKELFVGAHPRIMKSRRFVKVMSQVNGRGIVTSDGQDWEAQRRIIQRVLSPELLESYGRQVGEVVDVWAATRPGELVPRRDMSSLTVRVVGRVLFGLDLRQDEERLAAAARDVARARTTDFSALAVAPRWWPSRANRRKWAAVRQLRAFARDAVVRGESPFLSAMSTAHREGAISKQTIADDAVTLFDAGHLTTASALSWVWYRLGLEERWRREIIDEARAGRAGHPKLTAFLYESLRLHPPAVAMFLRESRVDADAGGWSFPRGCLLYASPLVTGRDARLFPDPERFDPGRFLDTSGEARRPGEGWFPFGVGPHTCVGMALALLEMRTIVSEVFRRFDAAPEVPFDGRVEVEFATWPRGENRWRLSPRDVN
jgi:cytochrome P450